MVAQHNGLVTCPKCGKTNLTPVGLCRHLADVHPVKVVVSVSPVSAVGVQIDTDCVLGPEVSCRNCFFNKDNKCCYRLFALVEERERQVYKLPPS